MKRYKSINGLIRVLGGEVKARQALISALKRAPSTKQQVMLLKYIETRSTTATAKFMKESHPKLGKVLPADVSNLITTGHDSLNPILLEFAREIFKRNKKTVRRVAG